MEVYEDFKTFKTGQIFTAEYEDSYIKSFYKQEKFIVGKFHTRKLIVKHPKKTYAVSYKNLKTGKQVLDFEEPLKNIKKVDKDKILGHLL